MDNIRFGVILVTYNRLNCLITALSKYDQQTKLPAYILVVDNASTDGTREYLAKWKSFASDYEKIVVTLPENTGGSGGFSRGIEEGSKLDCDFLFLADDDAYAESDMLENLEKGYQAIENKEKVSAICTSVVNCGVYEFSLRCFMKKGILRTKLIFSNNEHYKKERFQVDVLTFAGAAIKKSAAQKIGIPLKEYFIYFDDCEYSLRLINEGPIYTIPSSIMHHDVGQVKNYLSTWKGYYDTRNWIDMIHRHFPKRYYYFAVVEKYLKQCSVLAAIFRNRSREHRKMHGEAVRDAMHCKLGKNEKYLPDKK